MADNDQDKAAAKPKADDKPNTMVVESESQRANRALAQAAAEAEARQADEATPHEMTVDKRQPVGPDGSPAYGRYIVDGVLVDPNGRPFDQQPK